MYKKLILASLFVAATNVCAVHDINPQDVTPENIDACINERLNNESRDNILASMRDELEALYENGEISLEAYQACIEVVNSYSA